MLAEFIHLLDPFVFQVGDSFGIRWYGLAYVVGFVGAYYLYRLLAKWGYSDLKPADVGDFISGAAIAVLVGGRLGYYLFYQPQVWWTDPLQVLRIWEGGMSSHGGMVALFLYTLYYSNKHNLSWFNLGDNLCVVAPVGVFFGRVANFINGELYGRVTNVAWAVKFPTEKFTPEEIQAMREDPLELMAKAKELDPRHPSQIYEALLEGLLLFVVLWVFRLKVKAPNGVLTGLFFFLYGIVRIFAEEFREPDLGDPLLLSLSRGQWLSTVLLILGIGFIFLAFHRRTDASKGAS